jgi:hypothetical protein
LRRTSDTLAAIAGFTHDASPAFFPNGMLLTTERVFTSANFVQTEIMVLNVATGLTTRLTTNEDMDGGPRPGLREATALHPAIVR